MAAWLQKYWYARPITPASWLFLFPLILPCLCFAGLSALRRLAYRRGWRRSCALPVRVVVVGNLTVGGSGKTPLVLALLEQFRNAGWNPGVISRGYGGINQGEMPVDPDTNPAQTGDEPVLIARRGGVPVWVGRDRVAAGRALLANHPDIDLLICDDGLQHDRLRRNAELAVFDGRGIGNGCLLPLGPLREPLKRARRVTALVFNGPADPRVLKAARDTPSFGMSLEAASFYRLGQPELRASAAELRQRLKGKIPHAVAGIGNPDRFFQTLSNLGMTFKARPFPDHHTFRAEDFAFAPDGVFLMTEKDGVKCARLNLGEVWVLPVSARLEPQLLNILLETLNGRKTA